jgi:hypothetical protein
MVVSIPSAERISLTLVAAFGVIRSIDSGPGARFEESLVARAASDIASDLTLT